MRQPLALGKAVRMHHDEDAELLGSCKECAKLGIGQFLTIDRREDFDALQFQCTDYVVQLVDRNLRLLERDDAKPDKSIRPSRAKFGHAIIGEAMSRFCNL